MKEWMSTTDLSEYLGIPESRIRLLIKQNALPFSNRLGDVRFNRTEIDRWMREPLPQEVVTNETPDTNTEWLYREKPIKDYQLTASIVLTGETPWLRLPDFIQKTVSRVAELGRPYLYHEEFEPFMANSNDYLRICCQLGLIENLKEDERKKHYYPTQFAMKMATEKEPDQIKGLILESILDIVHKNMEIKPSEKYAILLLWYILKIKSKEIEPEESYFKLISDKPNNHYPSIRLGFALSLCYFLFNNNRQKEQEFLSDWEKLL